MSAIEFRIDLEGAGRDSRFRRDPPTGARAGPTPAPATSLRTSPETSPGAPAGAGKTHPSRQAARRAAPWTQVIAGAGAGTLATLAVAPAPGDEVTMYETAPPAREMAAILIGGGPEKKRGGRSRSIRMKPEADTNPTPGVLGFAVHFAIDSDRIDPMDRRFLDELARVMELPEMDGNVLVVEGHTDARGPEAYNDALSLRRARAVISYLVEAHDIPRSRLVPAGQGEREPLDRADPTAAVNRRVQFYLPGAKQQGRAP